ncbi:MAG: cytosolic protein [Cyanobacterium sp. T60_A2020_053]|nr:cytosolic protein [Cyanobacterium sp. T60_A2020_053]
MRNNLSKKDITNYVKNNIDKFHNKRIEKLENLDLHKILKRKNPYLYKAKNILTSQDFVTHILDAFLQSQEETLFGEFLEGLAVFVCQKVFNGYKSERLEGIDLEFVKDSTIYIVEIKSGPNWGNSSQIKKMKENFSNAKKILQSENKDQAVIAINGCCYGVEVNPYKREYFKYCGQEFWELISDNENLYTEIIEPLGYKAKEKNEAFLSAYAKLVNKLTYSFTKEFCLDGVINWTKIVEFNSQKLS